MKIITGTSGRINELLKGIPDEEFVSSSPFGDGKVMIVVKGEVGERASVGEPLDNKEPKSLTRAAKEIEVLTDAVKKLGAEIKGKDAIITNLNSDCIETQGQIQTLQEALSDALNAEQAAKKEAEDLKKQIPKLKASVAKLKKLIAED